MMLKECLFSAQELSFPLAASQRQRKKEIPLRPLRLCGEIAVPASQRAVGVPLCKTDSHASKSWKLRNLRTSRYVTPPRSDWHPMPLPAPHVQ